MAKIDFSKIEGYSDGLSVEEKLALIENYDPDSEPTPDPTPKPDPKPAPTPKGGDKTIAKAQFDKLASELAAAKKQLRAKMTEDEIKEAERQQEQESVRQELEVLRKEKTLSTYKAQYLAQGYDEQLATDTAEAMVEGDMDAVFLSMKKHGANLEKTLRAKILKDTPVPPAGDDPSMDAKKKKEMAELRSSFGLPPQK